LQREADGRRSIAAIDRQRRDLTLRNLWLPGADGWEVCRHLRARHPDVPVIRLSARSAKARRVLGPALGADDDLAKPFSMLEWVVRVRAAPAAVPVLRFGRWQLATTRHAPRAARCCRATAPRR
jgi:DNA-binding response OmpR family regulator